MENPLSILLVEDEQLECREIVAYIDSKDGVELVGVTNNIQKALEFVTDSQPDAIILDLELHKGYGDGLTFLDSLREMRLSYPIYVLVTTNNVSHITHDGARKMGADFIMVKSQDDYSAKRVIDFLYSLKSIIHSNKKTVSHSDYVNTPGQKQRRHNRIMTELDQIGIASNVLGRRYLLDGILLLIDGQNEGITIAVAEKNNKSVGSVERAMQHAIDKAWKVSCIEDLRKYYTARIHSAKGVPTITEFIHYYGEKVKNER
jgi:two-component system response regulator (stage 0 sporulation protein A)